LSAQYEVDEKVLDGVGFIIKHLQGPLFPRKIMTKKIGYQVEVFDIDSLLRLYRQSEYLDCRINAYPTFTEYKGINMTPPGFIMIDLDLIDFRNEKVKLDNALKDTINKIKKVIHGHPTVLWTGNGYHIYQPMNGFVLEELDVFTEFVDPSVQDLNLTTKFMRFAEGFFTDKKSDPQHGPSVSSCLLRIPSSYNSKYMGTSGSNGEVKVIQEWDEKRPAINYLLRGFRKYMINQSIRTKVIVEHRKSMHRKGNRLGRGFANKSKIGWIEKLLQIPIPDHRKYAIWRILAPYLINIRKMSESEAFRIIVEWLYKCNSLRRLDFPRNYLVKYNIKSARKSGYLPISFDNMKDTNRGLYTLLTPYLK
jgi:hypothetical protein